MSSLRYARSDLHVINQALFPRHNPAHEESSNLEVGGGGVPFQNRGVAWSKKDACLWLPFGGYRQL